MARLREQNNKFLGMESWCSIADPSFADFRENLMLTEWMNGGATI
jgi:hypothetical protein